MMGEKIVTLTAMLARPPGRNWAIADSMAFAQALGNGIMLLLVPNEPVPASYPLHPP
jgi:hypothetical protein